MRKETEENVEEGSPEITVSMFDHSVEEHFKAVDMISNLCEDRSEFDHAQITRLNSSVTFLREWRHFNYQPKIINFACQSESLQGKDVIGWINLPQFSAATVPKKDRHHVNTLSSESSKDFVMHVGGQVWALDWCPRIHQSSDCHIKSEFIAVATHPPESSYHKIGAPLTGRGVIQIWSLLNVNMEEDVAQVKTKPKQKSRLRETINKSTQPLKRRGRPRKNSTVETEDNLDGNNHLAEALSVQLSNNLSKLVVPDVVSGDTLETFANKDTGVARNIETVKINSTQPKKPRGRPRKNPIVESVNLDGSNHLLQDLAVQNRGDSSTLVLHNGLSGDIQETVAKKDSGRKRKSSSQTMSTKPKQDRGNSGQPNIKSSQPQKSRARPRKNPTSESVEDLDINYQYVQALSVHFPEDSSELLPIDAVARRSSRRKKKVFSEEVWECSPLTTSPPRRLKDRASGHIPGIDLHLSEQNDECSHMNPEMSSSCNLDPVWPREKVSNNGSFETSPAKCLVPKDVALPRVMLCLAHNGKVAWDVKWRPSNGCLTETKHRMGYLAVLLGNGALEVWEVPSPRAIKVIYSACQKEGIDPRFVKLEPVFKCSKLQFGDRLSIPLTVEWSTSSPHDLILAGCHDGVVALWKFSLNGSSKDTRPLLCFSADTVPIRALAWAPGESDLESANVIVTAGHKGLKFWDLRDPFRPLWDLNPVQRVIYSLDWLQDPRCVIVSFDDGTLRILSLSKAAYDVPVTGKPYAGTQQQGLHSYYCSSFTIWSVQVSRLTGMVAYCSADGTVLRFQLTSKAVEKDPLRNRAPHFLCGSLADEESALTVITPLPDIPFPMKKSLTEWGNAPRTIRGFLSVSNQEKRAKEQMAKGQISDEQPVALLYGDDPEIEFGCDETLMSQKSKQTPKTKMNNNKKLEEANQALILRNEDPENVERGDGEKLETGNEIEVFPSKMVAMHRVRWNMNKGSERWLCYGGAGGIVRCQEISMPST